jgi:electron transport complex protein RnfB
LLTRSRGFPGRLTDDARLRDEESNLAKKPRKKLPKTLAVINADNCTGCEACIEVCPVDCIYKVPGEGFPGLQSWCQIDLERCVGCEVCVHVPRKKSDPYELTVCPWDAIEMVPTTEVAQSVAVKGGPPEYVEKHWDELVGAAHRLAVLAAEG